MWFHFAFLLIVGAAVAATKPEYAWKPHHQYEYHLHSWSTTSMQQEKSVCGVVMKNVLTITVLSPDKLIGKITDAQHAHLNQKAHKILPNIYKDNLQFVKTPISENSFEVLLSNGVIQQVNTNHKLPAWNVNLLKGILSQLQVTIKDDISDSSESSDVWRYTTKEGSVTGNCDVDYELAVYPLKHQYVALPGVSSDDRTKTLLQIKKWKNYKSCKARSVHHFGVPLSSEKLVEENEDLISQYSSTYILATGDTKSFTIQHSMTHHGIQVSHRNNVHLTGQVSNVMNLTLINVKKLQSSEIHVPDEHLVSTKSLVYLPCCSNGDNHLDTNNSSDIAAKDQKHGGMTPQEEESSGNQLNAEINYFMLPETHMDEMPNNILMSFLSSDPVHLKDLSKNNKMVQKAVDLIEDMAQQIKDPNNIVSQEMLEKYLILTKIIRMVNVESINALVNKVFSHSNLDSESRYKRVILRDAIAQAGTGPAFIALKNLILGQKIHGLDAAKVIAQLPKVVRVPSRQYVRKFWDLITTPQLKDNEQLYIAAIMSFSELLRNLVIKDKYQPEADLSEYVKMIIRDINEVYIPSLVKNLYEAVETNNGPMIQLYILALSKTGQQTILSILKPHLEGKTPITKFQRLMAITSLATISRIHPVLTRQVLLKIYANEEEDHDARCMAVHLIIMSNPPLLTLQRMARFTNIDKSEQVNSVVKSSIETLAKLHDPNWHDVAAKARIAKKLLSRKGHNAMHSMGSYQETYDNKILHGFNIKTIGSDDYNLPKAAYLGVHSIFDKLGQATWESEYAVSSLKQLIGHWIGEKKKYNPENDKIAEKLNLKEDVIEPVEGNVYVTTLYNSHFYPFDNNTIDLYQLLNLIAKPNWAESLLYLHNFDVEKAVSMENGLPFVYQVNSPLLTHLEVNKEKYDGGSKNTLLKLKGKVNAIIAHKIQSRSGFVTPFDMTQYTSSVDSHSYMRIPIVSEVKVDRVPRNKPTVAVKISMDASEHDHHTKLLHIDNIATTARKPLLDFKPLSLAEEKQVVTNIRKTDISIGEKSIGVHVEENGKVKKLHLLPYIMKKINSEPKHNNFFQLQVNLDPSVAHEKIIDIQVAHDVAKIKSPSLSNAKKRGNLAKLLFPREIDSKVNSEKRKKQFQAELSKDIKLADIHVLDIGLEVPILPMLKNKRQAITVGVGNSKVDSELQILAYWNIQNTDETVNHEYCLGLDMQSSPVMPLNTEVVVGQIPEQTIKLEMRRGNSCKEAEKEEVQIKRARSHILEDDLINSDVYQRCRDEMEEGNKGLLACQKTNELAEERDLVLITSTNPESKASLIKSDFINYIKSHPITKKLGIREPKKDEKADIIWDQSQLIDTAIFESVFDKYIGALKDTILPSVVDSLKTPFNLPANSITPKPDNIVDRTVEQHPSNYWCAVDNTKTRKLDDDSRELKVLVDEEKTIHMHESGDGIKVTVNEEEVVISKHESYKDVDEELQQTIIEIMELPDASISFISEKYGIQGVYDGKRILIHLSDQHRASVRGICGDYDHNQKNDFLTPDKCAAKGPNDLVNSYVVPYMSCPRVAVAKVCEPSDPVGDTKRAMSHHKSEEPDVERRATLLRQHMTHVTKILENSHNNTICFSMRPVPACIKGTVPTDFSVKLIKYHCAPRTKSTIAMKDRIEKGANPNLSDKSVSMVQTHKLPLACYRPPAQRVVL